MSFDDYLQKSWGIHAEQSPALADGFAEAAALAENSTQLSQLVGLVTHVMGEHLGRWQDGINLLEAFKKHPAFQLESEIDFAIRRSAAVLKVAQGGELPGHDFSLSDRIRIGAVAASALAERQTNRAQSLLQEALKLARTGIEKSDPAIRALAIAGNNLAVALEEKGARTSEETELMILSAKTGLEYWSIAGSWIETSRAEYRLAMSYLKAQQFTLAFEHAQKCLDMCLQNQAGAFDLFFAYEAIAKVRLADGKDVQAQQAIQKSAEQLTQLDQGDRDYCEPIQKGLEAAVKL